MQDRFKFRFFDVENEEMYDVSAIDFLHSIGEIVSLDGLETLICKLDLDSLIPCTGKKDRNGILAYEGDIVEQSSFTGKNADKHKRYLIVGDTSGTGFQLKQINPAKYDHSYWYINRLQYDYNVIGNKFENPELLEE
jgi:uncharacterized phage protein (TIGR01671 family)|nr:MAG TPA_asm: YopX protein [Caudoviricetes sp.]